MRAKLTDKASIPSVIADMKMEEKLNLVGEYKACHTLEIPDMDIPSLGLYDGATGINGTQIVLDYITSPEISPAEENRMAFAYASPETIILNQENLKAAREKYADNEDFLGLINHIEQHRPDGKQHISFPSGVNIGASFSEECAEMTGRAVGKELRRSGVDICMGPNVDIARDPLGGRNYEMYGEDPCLVSDMAAAFINGMQSAGVWACAKHFIANNQETRRNTTNNHISERTLHEIYSRGFLSAVKRGNVRAIMSAYNAVNGQFSSYNKELLTDLLKEQWGFQGVVVSDWGAVTENKEDAVNAGMDMILCGPNDMSGCQKALEEGKLTEETLNHSVERILNAIVDLNELRKRVPEKYDQSELLEEARRCVTEGAVLLKNEGEVLPIKNGKKAAFYGKRSRDMIECGTGSTMVVTEMHSSVYECYVNNTSEELAVYDTMEGTDVLVYTVAAPAGENADREMMDIEAEDRQQLPLILKEAKEKGIKTVVILNIAGPVDMRNWIEYADAVLAVFIPGCMGGKATADMLCGIDVPKGRLPVTFPIRCQDTPAYPNFPGEFNDSYYGEGIFVGYRSYEKREVPVMFPFGFGLSYTQFTKTADKERIVFNTEREETLRIPVTVKNTGKREGSEVIQVYGSEIHPHILRPVKELIGYRKVHLSPGEEKTIEVEIRKESFQCYDPKMHKWVLPTGGYKLYIGTSSRDIFAEMDLVIRGKNPYVLNGDSTIEEVFQNPKARELVNEFCGGMFDMVTEEQLSFMLYRKLSDILRMGMIGVIPDTVKVEKILQELYQKLEKL